MDDMTKKCIERFEADYNKIASKEAWEPKDVTLMKDLQKLMYYLEVRDAMKSGGDYPGADYIDGRSFARGGNMQPRNQAGQYMSYTGMGSGNRYYANGGGSGHYPMNGGWYYDDGRGGSGRRYYDSERENAVYELRRMMDSKADPELKMQLQNVIKELEQK